MSLTDYLVYPRRDVRLTLHARISVDGPSVEEQTGSSSIGHPMSMRDAMLFCGRWGGGTGTVPVSQ